MAAAGLTEESHRWAGRRHQRWPAAAGAGAESPGLGGSGSHRGALVTESRVWGQPTGSRLTRTGDLVKVVVNAHW
jgi:hypothetical protein